MQRPTAPHGLVDELRARIQAGTSEAIARWTEPSLWVGKSLVTSMSRCEGMVLAERATMEAQPTRTMHPATAVGIVTHRALQLAHTHVGQTIAWYVEQSIDASLSEKGFSEFWLDAKPGVQSDLQMQMMSKVCGFLDSWPPLDDSWTWRFEEGIQAKVGRLTLSARVDLVLGRPRGDGRQTMLLTDFKTGSIGDHHELEASFYALVATLRHGVPPFRSCVYSLASGEWSDPDVTAERLLLTADVVASAARRYVEVMGAQREAELEYGEWCRWCPVVDTCPAATAAAAEAAVSIS